MTNPYTDILQAEGEAPIVDAPKNEYLGMLQADADQRKQALAGTLSGAVGTNPDQYSAKRKVAGYLGYPVAAVEAMPKLEEQAKTQRVQEDSAASPALRQKYSDADFARLAHDDSGALSAIAAGVKWVVSAPGTEGGLVSGVGKAGRAIASGVPKINEGLWKAAAAPFDLAAQAMGAKSDVGGFFRDLGAQAGASADRTMGADPTAGFGEKAVMSGFQSAGQNLAMLPVGLSTQGTAVVLGLMGLITGGQSYGKGIDKGLTPLNAAVYGAQDAVAEIVTEKYLGMAGFLKNVKAGASAGKLAMFEITKEVPGEMAATLWQNFNEWAAINPEKSMGEFIGEQPEAMAQTIIATLVGGGTQIAAVKGTQKVLDLANGREQLAMQTEAHAAHLQGLMATALDSKLRERDPQAFRDAVQAMAEDDPSRPQNIYVDAEVLNQLAPEVLQTLPGEVLGQLKDALAAGDAVSIPVGDALAIAPGTELEQTLVEHGRIGDPMAPSQAEARQAGEQAQEWLAAESASVIQQAQDSAAMRASSDAVRQSVLDQLNAVGRFRPAVNEGYATWTAAFYTTMAGRLGLTPEQMAAKYPLRIVGQTGQGAALEQSDERDLVITHNLTPANLLHAKKMGGIAVPSLAVTKKDNPLAGFGEITLVGDKDLADPKGYAGTKVFGADIYSPRYPTVERETDAKAITALQKRLRPMSEKMGEGALDTQDMQRKGQETLERDSAAMATFLVDKGIEPNIVMRTGLDDARRARLEEFGLGPFMAKTSIFDLTEDPAFRAAALAEALDAYKSIGKRDALVKSLETDERFQGNVVRETAQKIVNDAKLRARPEADRYATQTAMEKQITDANLQAEFRQWVQDELAKITKSERIFQGFTNGGGRKYIAHTLENVVKLLKKELRGGESFNYGVGSLRAKFTPEFKTLAAIKKEKGRLVSAGEFEATKKEINTEFDAVAEALGASSEMTTVVLEDAAKVGVPAAAKANGFTITDETAQKAAQFLTRLRNLPTAYFEAKVLRDVSLAEFKGAVVPDDISPEALAYLRENVGDVRTYKKGDEADRAAKVGEFKDLFFQGQAKGTFNPANLELALNKNADLSTFLHETGHFFLEVMADISNQPDAPAGIKADFETLLKWFGVTAEDWATMPLDQQRPYHERFAESIEQYLIEGNAPSVELQPVFRRMRAWMLNAYKSLKAFVDGRTGATDIQLSDEVRQVFDRMLAAEGDIQQAEELAGMMPDDEATASAMEKLAARSIRDLKWSINARGRAVKSLQKEAASLRQEVRIEARRDIMTQPIYRLWSLLTAHRTDEDKRKTFAERVKSDPLTLDPSIDSLLVAIAKLGGIQRTSAAEHLGVHPDDFAHPSGVFSKPVFRVEGGRSADAMGELLAENGYLLPSVDGRYDLAELERLIADEIWGDFQYSIAKQYSQESDRGGEGVDIHELNAGRFDLHDLKGLGLPEGTVEKLEAMKMTLKQGGIHPDILADAFGFAEGSALVTALLAAEPPLTAVDGRTDQLMLEQHGDLVDQRAIEAAANQAVHNEARAKSLATELKAQADALGARTDTGAVNAKGSKITVNALMKAAEQFAAKVVAGTTLKDLKAKAWQHTAAERRAAKRWQEATAKGDTAAAIKAKQDQVLNNAAAKAAMDAMGEAKKIAEFFQRVVRDGNEKTVEKGRDPDVVNAARAVLAAYGVGNKGAKSAIEYLELVEKHDPGLFATLQPSIQGALNMAQPLQALTMEQLQGLHEEIQAMWHLAQRTRQMEVAGNMMDIADAVDELAARMQTIGVPVVIPGESGALTAAETRARWLQHAASLLRRVEQWAEGMDGKFGGPFLRLVFQPVKDAAERYRSDRVKYRKAYQALVDAVAPSLRKGLIEAPELGYTFGKGHNGIGHAELLHAILHTGNESNKRKLLLGRKWATENVDGSLDTNKWDAFLARAHRDGVLGKVHYDFAQGVWDLLEQTKPLAQKTHRDVFGRYFAEVTADSFSTPFGDYRGGYVPAQADPRIVQDAAMRDLASQENETMAFSFPGTAKGFTKGRVEYNRPLMLDLRTIGQHIDKVLLFSHMERHVRDVNKLLSQPGVSQSLGKIDPTVYAGMLTPWLNRSARQIVETPVVGDGGISRVLSAARGRAGMALMFANVSNTIQQLTGFAGAFAKLKADGMHSTTLASAAQFIRGPKAMAENVATLSPFMRERMAHEISAINDAMDAILLDPSLYAKAQAWTAKHAYFLQSAFDNTMGPIIWNSAYNAALAKGHPQDQAVRYADGVIRQTQGSTLPEDVSRIETGPAYARIFTQFIGYFNMVANTNGTMLKQIAQEEGLKKGAGKALMLVTLGMMVPIWVASAIAEGMRGGPDDEDGDGYLDDWLAAVFGLGTIKGMFAMVPFVGQIANVGINTWNGNPSDDRMSMSPAVSLLEGAVRAPVSVYKAIAEDGSQAKAVKDVATAVSIATGLPAVAIARPLSYVAGVDQGTISPTGPVDAVRGTVTGTASPESRNR